MMLPLFRLSNQLTRQGIKKLKRPLCLWRISRATKVIIAASGTALPGWIATDQDVLDVCDSQTFLRLWSKPRISHFLAEHVWEHLDERCAIQAIRNCSRVLILGGRLRIAVPDGNHPNSEYIEQVRPGGSGSGSDDHKHLFTVTTLSDLIREGGLHPEPLEWWDNQGSFHKKLWHGEDGMIERSADHDQRNLLHPLSYTSLIIDAFKRND
jgi:predicted SAM-dependent methyltransferase